MQFNRLVHSRHGLMLVNAGDIYVGRSLTVYGEFSETEVLFLQTAAAGGVAVDVGANIGATAIPIARTAGFVFAIEAQPTCFQVLCANVALNSLMNVRAMNAVVADHAGTGNVTVPLLDPRIPNNFGGLDIRREDATARASISATTVDSMRLPSCNLIKIDVEGMECEVIDGAAETIKKFIPIISAENDRSENSDRLIEKIKSFSCYRLFNHVIPLFNPSNFRGVEENIFGDEGSINLVAIPESRIEEIGPDRFGMTPM